MELEDTQPPRTIRLVLAGEPSMVHDGVRSLLCAVDDFELVGEAADRAQTVQAVRQLQPDVLVVDTGPGPAHGVTSPDVAEVTRTAQARGTQVIILADHVDDAALLRAAHSGVAGYLLKDDGTGSLISAVRAAAGGDAWLSPSVTRQLLDHYRAQAPAMTLVEGTGRRVDSLSERERGVVRLLARGYSNAEIAQELTLGRSTVKTHVSRILAKLELRDRVQLAAFAHQNDLT